MFEFVKFFTSPAFRKHDFVAMLEENNITAKAVEDGVVLDRAAYNATENLPQWAEIMRADINNQFKVRPADVTEWPWRHRKNYVLLVEHDDGEVFELLQSDNLNDMMEQSDFCETLNISCVVVNTRTGERIL